MALNVVNIDWLNKFADKSGDILNEYKESLGEVKSFNPIMHPLWQLVDAKSNANEYYPTLNKLIEELPENIYLSLATFSSITPGMVGMFHNEPYPTYLGFRRYHVVLQTEDTAKFEIEGEGITTWETGKVYEFTNPETQHRILYPEGKDERINLIIDIFNNGEPSYDVLRMTRDIAEGFIDRSKG
jgi:hypothetical protein